MKTPTAEEVRAYFAAKSLHGDPDEFWDHFEERDWKPKGYTTRMKSWEAAARNWSRQEARWGPPPNGRRYPDEKTLVEFNKAMAGLSMEAYRQRFKERFGVDLREERP